jgi:hypothetical protein
LTRYIIYKDVSLRPLTDKIVVYKKEEPFIIKGLGAHILQEINNGEDHEKILNDITANYEINESIASKDLDEFIEFLLKKQIISKA